MRTKLTLIFAILIIVGYDLFADSPLTSTEISKSYINNSYVNLANKAKGKITIELMDYMFEPTNPIDIKIAIINALSWDHEGVFNSDIYFTYLKSNNKFNTYQDFIDNADWDLLICMAYLKALDDYFNVDESISLAKKARSKNLKSYTVNIICALIEAQKAMNNSWCDVYNVTNDVRKNGSLKKDMSDDAIKNIFEYMDLYKSECNK